MIRSKKVIRLMKEADELLDLARFEEAEKICIQAIDIDKKDPEPYYLLGEALCKQERFDEAVQSLNIANKLFPEHPNILHLLGWATFLNGNPEKGRELMIKGLILQPDNIKILCDLAVLEMNLFNYDKADKYISQAYKLVPEDPAVQEVKIAVATFSKMHEELLKKAN